MSTQVEVKIVEPQRVFRWRGRVAMSKIGQKMGETFGAMVLHMNEHGAQIAGPPLTLSYDEPQPDGTIDIEFALPIDRDLPPLGDMSSRVVEGGDVAATIHKGPYGKVGAAHGRVAAWIQANGYEAIGPAREIYLNDPGEVKNPAEYLTEVAYPVRKKA